MDALESRDTERCRKALVEHICNTYYTLGLPLKLRADGAPLLGQPPAKQRRRGGRQIAARKPRRASPSRPRRLIERGPFFALFNASQPQTPRVFSAFRAY